MLNKALTPLVLLTVLVSCRQPDSYEQFERVNPEGVYAFGIDFSQENSVYDLSFYTRKENEVTGGFYMDIEWCSPSGSTMREKVWYDYDKNPVPLYRVDCVPSERGVWTLKVRPGTTDILGLGVICRRRDGTR